MQTKLGRVHIRWLIRRDFAEVLDIERRASPKPWNEDGFILALKHRNCIGMVAEHKERVVGFVVYELHRSRLHILNLAVDPDLHRHGIGRAIILTFVRKLSRQRRTQITAQVPDGWERAELFYSRMWFLAVSRADFDEPGLTWFEYDLDPRDQDLAEQVFSDKHECETPEDAT